LSESELEKKNSDSFYSATTETCDRHEGVKVVYERSKYQECPLCAALDEIADYEAPD
jgi:hypothetical protein